MLRNFLKKPIDKGFHCGAFLVIAQGKTRLCLE